MTGSGPEHGDQIWSEIRQQLMPKLEERLYLERAGLAPEEAVKWWERYIFSREAADAVSAGRTIEEELELLPERREAQRAEHQQQTETQQQRQVAARDKERRREEERRALEQQERDKVAASTDFLAGLSPTTAALVRRITKIKLDEESDYPPGLYVDADDGRMKCTQYEIVDGYTSGEIRYFDATFRQVLEFAVEHSVIDLDLGGLDSQQAVQLLTASDVWPATRRLFDGRDEHNPVLVNGFACHAVDDSLVELDVENGVIVWADYAYDDIQLGLLRDFELLAESARETNLALAANTWEELVDVFGREGVEHEFSDFLDQAWEEWCIEHDTNDARPDDWLPQHVPDLTGDWLSSRPRYNDPEQLDLPQEFMDLGRYQTTMMGGDFVSWDRSDLPKLERLAVRLGYEFVERQELIVWS